jgi:lipoprotein-releasing system permease protein
MAQGSTDTRPFAPFEWKLALRYLRARRKEGFISVISLFSFLGIMLGVATLIVVMSIFNGFHQELLSKVLGFSGHATIYHPQLEPLVDYDAMRGRIEKVEDVTAAMPLIEGQVMVSSIKTATGALVRSMGEKDLQNLPSINNDALRTAIAKPGALDEKPSLTGFDTSDGVAIGERMAWRHQVGLGDTITLISPSGPDTVMGSAPRIRDYPIVAIFKMGMSEYDENVVYLPLPEAKDFFDMGEGVTALEIITKDPETIRSLLDPLRKAAGEGFMLQTWQDRNQAFFTALTVERNMLFLVVTMIVLVAALNIISGLIMLVKDKSRDIAILRTMGATASAMQRVFFITGAAIGMAGTIAGLLLGLLIASNAENIRKGVQWLTGVDAFNADLYYLSQLPARIEPAQVALIVFLTLLLTFLATLYPSWRAAKLDPVEALRYE